MNMKEKQEIPFRERFDGFTVNPSPKVWQNIEAAKPAPVAKPGIRWIAVTGAAAFILVALWWVLRQEAPVSTTSPIGQKTEPIQNKGIIASAEASKSIENPAVQPASGSHITIQQQTVPANPTTSSQTQQTQPLQPAAGNSAGNQAVYPISSASTSGTTSGRPAETTLKTLPETKPNPRLPERTPAKIVSSDPVNDTTGANTGNEKLEIFIPNAFAPGTYGPNSIFMPVVKNNAPVKDYKMQIFSRAGVLIFESNDVETGWDGRFGGDIVNDQVCAYIITFRDEAGYPYARKGTITLVR